MARENIYNFYHQIIGSIETLSDGSKIARDFYGKILGKFDAKTGVTKNFYGQIVAKGDITSALVWQEYNEHPF